MTVNIPLSTILETDRLRLRSVSDADIELIWSATRFEGFTDGMPWDPPDSKEEILARLPKHIDAWNDGVSYIFTIELTKIDNPIGRIAIRKTNTPNIWNIGFWIHPEYWNNGYATEAAKEILFFGFTRLGAEKITTAHAKWNSVSKRVIEKLGFKITGENPCGFRKGGKPVPEYEYVIEENVL